MCGENTVITICSLEAAEYSTNLMNRASNFDMSLEWVEGLFKPENSTVHKRPPAYLIYLCYDVGVQSKIPLNQEMFQNIR